MPSIQQRATAKVGPLPVWGWAVAALVLYVAYSHFRHAPSAAAAVTPAPNIQSSGQSTGDAGLGNPAGNLSADLLSALGQGVFGIHDAYNTWTYSPTSSYEYSSASSTTTDYGTGNTFDYGGGGTQPTGNAPGTDPHNIPTNFPPVTLPPSWPTNAPGVAGAGARAADAGFRIPTIPAVNVTPSNMRYGGVIAP